MSCKNIPLNRLPSKTTVLTSEHVSGKGLSLVLLEILQRRRNCVLFAKFRSLRNQQKQEIARENFSALLALRRKWPFHVIHTTHNYPEQSIIEPIPCITHHSHRVLWLDLLHPNIYYHRILPQDKRMRGREEKLPTDAMILRSRLWQQPFVLSEDHGQEAEWAAEG